MNGLRRNKSIMHAQTPGTKKNGNATQPLFASAIKQPQT